MPLGVGMSQVVRQVKVPARVRLWKSRKNYIAVVTDEATKKVLEQYLDKKGRGRDCGRFDRGEAR